MVNRRIAAQVGADAGNGDRQILRPLRRAEVVGAPANIAVVDVERIGMSGNAINVESRAIDNIQSAGIGRP